MDLQSPKEECRHWLSKKIEVEFFTAEDSESTLYQKKAKQRLLEIHHQIKDSIEEARNQSVGGNMVTNLADWLDIFRLNEKLEVGFAESDFHTMKLRSESIKDMDNFIRNVVRELNDCEKDIRKHFDGCVEDKVISHFSHLASPRDSLLGLALWGKGNDRFDEAFDEVWGCNVQCPFCGEFCRLGEKHEGKNHVCIQHRPAGMHGVHDRTTKKLCSENCSINIQLNKAFSCYFCQQRGLCTKDGCDEYHEFKQYKRYFPDWEIYPSADGTEKCEFWAFMMWRHAENLSKYYGRKLPDMPSSWGTITAEMATESLNDLSS